MIRRRRSRRTARAFAVTACAVTLLFAPSAFAAIPPAPNEPIPRNATTLAETLVRTSAGLGAAIDRWTPKTKAAPAEVALYALYQQRIYRVLARNEELSAKTVVRLPSALRKLSRDVLRAHRELYRLTPPIAARAIKVGPALPAGILFGYYREIGRASCRERV